LPISFAINLDFSILEERERQRTGCLKALRELERKKHIVLPQSGTRGVKRSPRRLVEGVTEAKEVPGDVSEIRELRVISI
jgi:hypothetical protein